MLQSENCHVHSRLQSQKEAGMGAQCGEQPVWGTATPGANLTRRQGTDLQQSTFSLILVPDYLP